MRIPNNKTYKLSIKIHLNGRNAAHPFSCSYSYYNYIIPTYEISLRKFTYMNSINKKHLGVMIPHIHDITHSRSFLIDFKFWKKIVT